MTYRAFLAVALLSVSPAFAGAYFGSDSDTLCGGPCRNAIIVHTAGYTSAGMGGEIAVPVCIRSGDAPFVQRAVEEAISVWNGLTPTTGNCRDCGSSDDPAVPDGITVMETVTIHELGHCIGLDHSNFDDVAIDINNFTDADDALAFDPGTDTVRGSRDDIITPDPLPPDPNALLLHWFRIADNDPVVIDATVIDFNTYSIIPAQLPPGSTFPANANRYVSDLLGAGDDTQNVMHAAVVRNLAYTGLVADDVNTIRHAMTGLDRTAATADDYTIRFELVDDCAGATIEVQWEALGPPGPGGQVLGFCNGELEYIGQDPPGPAGRIHYAMTAPLVPPLPRITMQINSEALWGIFADGFETGDLSRWSP
ncbi:MAG: hypothetical protein AAF657_25275 [Acidobacteriota bacterium]